MVPTRSRPPKTRRGPNLSHRGPETSRTSRLGGVSGLRRLLLWEFVTYVAHKDTMLELATSSGERLRSFLMVWVN
jgi:hypothetical protein